MVNATAPLYGRACPGAAKTTVLVERHCSTPTGSRRSGRALISFTNAAAAPEENQGIRPDLILLRRCPLPGVGSSVGRVVWGAICRETPGR